MFDPWNSKEQCNLGNFITNTVPGYLLYNSRNINNRDMGCTPPDQSCKSKYFPHVNIVTRFYDIHISTYRLNKPLANLNIYPLVMTMFLWTFFKKLICKETFEIPPICKLLFLVDAINTFLNWGEIVIFLGSLISSFQIVFYLTLMSQSSHYSPTPQVPQIVRPRKLFFF